MAICELLETSPEFRKKIRYWEDLPGKEIVEVFSNNRDGILSLLFPDSWIDLESVELHQSVFVYPENLDPAEVEILPESSLVGETIRKVTVPFFAPGFR